MATAPVKSQPLHNFNFPFLKWGAHGSVGSSASATATEHRCSPESDSDHDRLRSTRVGSRSTRIHRLSFPTPPKPISPKEEEQTEQPPKPRESEAEEEEEEEETVQRPWNLRPRKVMMESTTVLTAAMEKVSETTAPKSTRLRGLAENGAVGEKKEKRKFWIALSREEIEEDIYALTGSRPARRPKKRPKNIQKQLDNVFPGLWLVGSTADTYRVADTPHKK